MLQAIFTAIAPHLVELASVIIAGALLWVSNALRRRWNIEIEAKHRDALHSAIMTGINLAVERGVLTKRDIAREAAAYAQRSVPDAIQALKPRADMLVDIATARLKDVVGLK